VEKSLFGKSTWNVKPEYYWRNPRSPGGCSLGHCRGERGVKLPSGAGAPTPWLVDVVSSLCLTCFIINSWAGRGNLTAASILQADIVKFPSVGRQRGSWVHGAIRSPWPAWQHAGGCGVGRDRRGGRGAGTRSRGSPGLIKLLLIGSPGSAEWRNTQQSTARGGAPAVCCYHLIYMNGKQRLLFVPVAPAFGLVF